MHRRTSPREGGYVKKVRRRVRVLGIRGWYNEHDCRQVGSRENEIQRLGSRAVMKGINRLQ